VIRNIFPRTRTLAFTPGLSAILHDRHTQGLLPSGKPKRCFFDKFSISLAAESTDEFWWFQGS
jgi:hypothetical protein